MIRAHNAAVQALLAAAGFTIVTAEDPLPADPNALPVFPGGARDGVPQQRYAVMWTDSGTRTGEYLCVGSDRLDMLVTVTSLGTSDDQAGWVAEQAFVALLDQRPVVAARKCQPITHVTSDPVRRDDSVIAPGGSPMYQQVDVFRLVSRPG